MYNAGIEKAIPATLPHTPSCKVRNEGIVLPIHGPLRRHPYHWLPNAVAIRREADHDQSSRCPHASSIGRDPSW